MERIGFVGLGIMGSRMAANLRRAGYELTVFNRTRETRARPGRPSTARTVADDARRASARPATSSSRMVVDGAQVQEVLLGEHGVATGAARGHAVRRHVDDRARATARASPPALAPRGLALRRRAGDRLVSPKAEDGTLTIMAGGDAEDFARAQPAVRGHGRADRARRRRVGQGQMVKLINNAVAAANAHTLAQALRRRPRDRRRPRRAAQVMGAGSGG